MMKLNTFIILFILLTPAKADIEKLLDAIRQVESSGGTDKRDGDNRAAVGDYQLHKIFVRDVNRILGEDRYTYDDRRDPEKSRTMARIWFTHYLKHWSFEKTVRWYNDGKKWQSEKGRRYYEKVRKYL
jgi:hypothetical protein